MADAVVEDDAPPGLTDTPARPSAYDPMIAAAAKKYGVNPARIRAIIEQESAFNPSAYNKESGAAGLGQFIPAVATSYGIDPYDPEQAIDATARMFKENMSRFKDENKATAAHFAGPNQKMWGPKTEQYIRDVNARMPPVTDEPPGLTDEPPGMTSAAPASALTANPALFKGTKSSEPDVANAVTGMMPGGGAAGEVLTALGSGFAGIALGTAAGLTSIPLNFAAMQAQKAAKAAGVDPSGVVMKKLDQLVAMDPIMVKNMIQQGMTVQPKTAEGKDLLENNPLTYIAKLWDQVAGVGADKLVPESVNKEFPNLKAGVKEAVVQAPVFAGAPVSRAVGGMAGGAAERLMQSALKPPAAAQDSGKAAQAIRYMLDNGINVSKGSAEAMQARVDALNGQISNIIANSPATIDKAQVASRVQDVFNRFTMQVNNAKDLNSIQRALDEFNNTWPTQIPVQTAQAMKQGTYRVLNSKYTGELGSADIATQKSLARGLKEEIAQAVPEVRPLNAEESQLLNALPLVERRVLREANNNVIGLGVLSHSPIGFLTWMSDKSSLFKSLVARMLNTGGGLAKDTAPLSSVAAGVSVNQPQ